MLANRHRMMPDVSFYSGKAFHIRARGRIKMQMDGDKAPSPPARIYLRERFLPVFVHKNEKRPEGLEAVKTVLSSVFRPAAPRATRR